MDDQRRFDALDDKITILASSHSELRERVDSMATTVNSHSIVINKMEQTQADIRELLEVFNSVKSGMTVLGWLGVFAKWAWPIVATVVGVWVYLKTGSWKKI